MVEGILKSGMKVRKNKVSWESVKKDSDTKLVPLVQCAPGL